MIVSITLFDDSEHLSNFYLENVTKILDGEFYGNRVVHSSATP